MIEIKGTWFDGQTSHSRNARLTIFESGRWQVTCCKKNTVLLQGNAANKPTISPRLGNTPRYISFAGDETLETSDNESVDEALKILQGGHWSLMVHLFESKLRYVFIAVVLLLIFAFGAIKYGIPSLSKYLADHIPPAVLEKTGEQTLTALDKVFFSESELPEEREETLRQYFQPVLDQHADLNIEIVFRKAEKIGANAFALPSGQIVFTDEMVLLAEHDDELLAILIHEVGHIAHRHGLRRLIQDSILSFAILSLTGDASGVSEVFLGLPVVLTELGYSRGFEIEADNYALQYLENYSIDKSHFANILRRLSNQHNGDNDTQELEETRWGQYLSTHPATDERIERIASEPNP